MPDAIEKEELTIATRFIGDAAVRTKFFATCADQYITADMRKAISDAMRLDEQHLGPGLAPPPYLDAATLELAIALEEEDRQLARLDRRAAAEAEHPTSAHGVESAGVEAYDGRMKIRVLVDATASLLGPAEEEDIDDEFDDGSG